MSTNVITRNKNNKLLHVFENLITYQGHQENNKHPNYYLGEGMDNIEYCDKLHKLTLVAGTTGSGRSLFLETFVLDLTKRYSPEELVFILIDPKRTQFPHFSSLPHLISPVITNTDISRLVFEWLIKELERRYKLLEDNNCRYIEQLSNKGYVVPHIVVVVDEFAEVLVTDPGLIERYVIRLAQLGKSVGIHLVLSVLRPSENILTPLIKTNADAYLAFHLTSNQDSIAFLGQPDASGLKGKGDMLYKTSNVGSIRIQAEFITTEEISKGIEELSVRYEQVYDKSLINHLINKPEFKLASDEPIDELIDEAVKISQEEGKVSASLLQKKLQIGYARAARLADEIKKKINTAKEYVR